MRRSAPPCSQEGTYGWCTSPSLPLRHSTPPCSVGRCPCLNSPIGCSLSPSEFQELDGFILVAQEGINGSICGSKAEVDALFAWLEADARLEGLRRNYTPVENLGQSPAHSDPYSHSHPHSRRRTPSPPRPSMHPDEPFRREGVRVRHKAEVSMGTHRNSPSSFACGQHRTGELCSRVLN